MRGARAGGWEDGSAPQTGVGEQWGMGGPRESASCPGGPGWLVHGAGPGPWLRADPGFQTQGRSRWEKTLAVLQLLLPSPGLPSVGSVAPQPPGIPRPWHRDPKSSKGWGLGYCISRRHRGSERPPSLPPPRLGASPAPAPSTCTGRCWASSSPSPSLPALCGWG